MKKVFIINGGAGRVIAAIPALKKYIKNNPEDEVRILVHGWDAMYWSIPELQQVTFPLELKGQFEQHFLDADAVVSPEPYQLPSYYRQEVSLSEAFDEIINSTTDHTDLLPPKIELMTSEKAYGVNLAKQAKNHQGKEKAILIQPFGRSAEISPDGTIYDNTSRSLNPNVFLKLCELLSKKFTLMLMAEPQFHMQQDVFTFKSQQDMRGLIPLVYGADYFLGCDSLGQHIARSLDKPGTVIIGSTFEKNTTYPDYFQILKKDNPKVYAPIRCVQTDSNFADRSNSDCMNFTDEEIVLMAKSIEQHLNNNC